MSDKGYSAGAINSARCSLSCLLPKQANGDTRGKSFWVSRAVRAGSLANPSRPKYPYFWDVSIVLKLFVDLGPNKMLELDVLTRKLVVLILLVTGHRGQMLVALDLDEMTQDQENKVEFILTNP